MTQRMRKISQQRILMPRLWVSYVLPASLRQAIYGIYTLSLVESSIILGDHKFKILLLRMCSRVSWKVFLQEVVINYEWDEEHRNRNDS